MLQVDIYFVCFHLRRGAPGRFLSQFVPSFWLQMANGPN